MFETYQVILKDNTRNLIKKIKETPVLYLVFAGMMLFSLFMFSFTTYYLLKIDTSLDITLEDVYLSIIFIFFIKSAADIYNNYIKSSKLYYSLSTKNDQRKTIAEIFLAVLTINSIIWFSLSIFFIFCLSIFKVDINYPLEYFHFTIGIISAISIGATVCINFFSTKRYRLIPTIILIGFILISRNMEFITLLFPLVLLHLGWTIKNGLDSHLNIRRKERTKETSQIKKRSVIRSIFYKETTTIWRDKLYFSFILTSAISGFFSGYLYLNGVELLIPEFLRDRFDTGFISSMFIFLGVFVVVLYIAVFPSLNLFLNEEKTMWIIKHLPIRNDTLVYGKISSLILCLITTIPFVAFVSIYTGFENMLFLTWFLLFSFIAGIIVTVPLGIKYVGKKSDILLLYSVAMILFVVLSIGAVFGYMIKTRYPYPVLLYTLFLLCELGIFYFSIKLSSRILIHSY